MAGLLKAGACSLRRLSCLLSGHWSPILLISAWAHGRSYLCCRSAAQHQICTSRCKLREGQKQKDTFVPLYHPIDSDPLQRKRVFLWLDFSQSIFPFNFFRCQSFEPQRLRKFHTPTLCRLWILIATWKTSQVSFHRKVPWIWWHRVLPLLAYPPLDLEALELQNSEPSGKRVWMMGPLLIWKKILLPGKRTWQWHIIYCT